MIVGIPKETFHGQRQVAVVPDGVAALGKAGLEVVVQVGAGTDAGYPDELFRQKGATLVSSRQ
ncbi:MAG TPA: NAD(P)(+) transhydrogenase (Re/Si-specific) subunit alpha, partial [Candidatus Glassbacteria bacterium]|nr:NAD(P)(+) transhydrogenase (Re/Si-specific) subunit alpha [Candidatus Glassbacteria bacterium]